MEGGSTGQAFMEMSTSKNFYTKLNLSLSLQLISLLQGNVETEGPHADLREG